MVATLNPAQADANRLLGSPATHILLRGGSRSGKTFLLIRAIVIRAVKAPGSRPADHDTGHATPVKAVRYGVTATTSTDPNATLNWCSYTGTGNVACIQTATAVASAVNARVLATGGASTSQTLASPSETSGTYTSGSYSGGTMTGTDTGASVATASNSIATGTMPRTPAERAMSLPQPQDFLSTGETVASLISGGIDVGPIINAMFTAGVKTVHLPCGTYKLATAISMLDSTALSGDGQCTILSIQDAGDDMITVPAHQYIRVHDLAMQADITRTGGSAVALHNSYAVSVYNVMFTNGSGRHYTNIYLDGANSTRIDRVTGRGGAWNGVTATGSTQRSEDTYITNSSWDGYGGAPIELIWSSGNYLSQLDLLGGVNAGVMVDPGSGQEVDGLRATAVLADSNYGPGWNFAGTGAITETNLTNCWGSTNGIGGSVVAGLVATNANINNMTVASSEFHTNTGTGIDIQAGRRIQIIGNSVMMNSTAKSAAYPGINVGAAPNFVVVANNMSGAGGEGQGSATASNQSYGIVSAQETTDAGQYALFSGNMATGNQTGGFNIPTSTAATNVVSSNNVGF